MGVGIGVGSAIGNQAPTYRRKGGGVGDYGGGWLEPAEAMAGPPSGRSLHVSVSSSHPKPPGALQEGTGAELGHRPRRRLALLSHDGPYLSMLRHDTGGKKAERAWLGS